jgi:hypothetical protein
MTLEKKSPTATAKGNSDDECSSSEEEWFLYDTDEELDNEEKTLPNEKKI